MHDALSTTGVVAIGEGCFLYPGLVERKRQEALLAAIQGRIAGSPLFVPRMPRTGAPLSVRMTNLGTLGWVADREGGYRYQATHPETGEPWPTIPAMLLDLWDTVCCGEPPPEACLVNHYNGAARMGLHVDADEQATSVPVLSISLGDTALFRLGGPVRRAPTRAFRLTSGDVLVLGGASRHFFHGVDRILPGTSTLLPGGGRLNLTLRRVTLPVTSARHDL